MDDEVQRFMERLLDAKQLDDVFVLARISAPKARVSPLLLSEMLVPNRSFAPVLEASR